MDAVDVYIAPRVSDYGSLEELTATVYPLLGADGSADLTFSAAQAGPPEGGTAGAGSETELLQTTGSTGGEPTADGDVRGGEASGGEPSGGGDGSGGAGAGDSGGGGGNLPFTGFAAGAVALAGSALAVAGRTLRRATSRRF